MHLATRHRNQLALHSELLGAHVLGVRNIFVVMGDLPRIGDYPNATAVSDVTATGLIRLMKRFNEGYDLAGKPIDQPAAFFVGCAFNMAAPDPDRELRVLERKLAAGADFILSAVGVQPGDCGVVVATPGRLPPASSHGTSSSAQLAPRRVSPP